LTLANARMPGRMELVSRKPMIVVDGAHNPAGVKALVATLDGAFHVAGERRCVLGMLSGRDIDDMVEPLVSLASRSSTVVHHTRRGGAGERGRERRASSRWRRVRTPECDGGLGARARTFNRRGPHRRRGSLYLVAEVRGEVIAGALASPHLTLLDFFVVDRTLFM